MSLFLMQNKPKLEDLLKFFLAEIQKKEYEAHTWVKLFVFILISSILPKERGMHNW